MTEKQIVPPPQLSLIRGYYYVIYEAFPGKESGDTHIKDILVRDNLQDAETVLDAMIATDINFSCYGIRLQPIWKTR